VQFNRLTTPLFRLLKLFFIWPVVSYYRVIHPTLLENSLTVFVFHDISDEPSEFCAKYGLNVSPALFEYQIGFIKNEFNIISSDDLLEARIPPKAALITFDDGFRSYFKNAVPILKKYSVPSIIFLNMEPVEGAIFWSGLITYLCERKEDFRDYLKSNLLERTTPKKPLFLYCSRNLVDSYIKKAGESFEKEVSQFVGEFATEEDLVEASVNPLIFYGNHLFNHDVPILMSNEELLMSYSQNYDCLIKYSNYRDMFSFPFGQPGTCFRKGQVDLVIKNGAKKVFSSAGNINWNVSSLYLDRITLTEFHNSDSRIWFQIFQMSFRKKIKRIGLKDNLYKN